jgi:hypothetical protein
VVASSVFGQAVIRLQGSLPFVLVLGSVVQSFAKKAKWAGTAGLSPARHCAHAGQGRSNAGVLALRRRVSHAPGQLLVGASRRLKSQSVGAAVSGGASFAVCARPLMHALRVSGRAARVTPRPLHRAMLNPSIERTSPGKPGAASRVKR